ncbi:MAG: DUF305 domain-containing protein [Gemmatimonadota bacterium]
MKSHMSAGVVAAVMPLFFVMAAGPPSPLENAVRTHPSVAAAADTGPRYTKADVEFMQGMIGHHAQALVMAALVPARSKLPALALLAERITVSQRDEIKLMQRWLKDRGEMVPDPGSGHDHHDMGSHDLMPGMASPAELAQLAAAKGTEFDRLFLTLMIRHHEGALVMVARLFGTPGAGQEAEAFRFASDVDPDQRAEIRRMRLLLDALPNG